VSYLLKAYLDSVTELSTVATLDLGPILRLRAVAGEVTCLLTVAALDIIRVTRLVALFSHVVLGAAVVAGALRDVGALILLAVVCHEGTG
jgi:hypothetical protein